MKNRRSFTLGPGNQASFGFPLLVLVVGTLALLGCQGARSEPLRDYNVVLISLDTLGAGHLDAYGYHRKTAPFLSRLAREGINFEAAFAHSPYTETSHTSMLTGILPGLLHPDAKTLPEMLRAAGYRTAWFGPQAGPALPLDKLFGRGIDEVHPPGLYEHSLPDIVKWFAAHKSTKFYAFIHSYLVHDPYIPPARFNIFAPAYDGAMSGDPQRFMAELEKTEPDAEFIEIQGAWKGRNVFWKNLRGEADVEYLRALYDAEILYLDSLLSRLFDELKRLDMLQRTLFVVTSDHGEAFFEHKDFLHQSLHQEVLHIPLIFVGTGLEPAAIKRQVQSADIVPTVLEMLGLPVPDLIEGKSLVALMKGETNEHVEYIYSRFMYDASIRSEKWKLILYANNSIELYDLSKDPHEKNNIAHVNLDVVKRMRNELVSILLGLYRGRE